MSIKKKIKLCDCFVLYTISEIFQHENLKNKFVGSNLIDLIAYIVKNALKY